MIDRVVHIGPVGRQPGGMAQVINQYVTWSDDSLVVDAMASTRYRRDPIAVLLALRCALLILLSWIRRGRISYVFHLSEGGSFVREGMLLALSRSLGFRSIAHLHGAQFVQFANSHGRLASAVLRRCSAVIVLTSSTNAKVREIVGHAAEVWQVANPVEPYEIDLKKSNVVVFAGEVCKRKGVDVLVDAWHSLSDRHPTWQLVIVGPESDVAVPPALKRCRYMGARPHTEVLELLGSASIGVLPSRNEALPMFLLESMAAGCAVVGTSVGEVEDLVVGPAVCGLVVEPGSVSALSAALERLMFDDNFRDQCAEAGVRIVAEFYASAIVRRKLQEIWTGRNSHKGENL